MGCAGHEGRSKTAEAAEKPPLRVFSGEEEVI